MVRARRIVGIVVTVLIALAAMALGSRGVSSSSSTASEHDSVRSSRLIVDERAATPVESESEARARATKRGSSKPFAARPLFGFEGLAAAFTLGVAVLSAAAYLGRDPVVAAWASGAIRDRAPPLVTTA
jgi:hypothetical protein